MLPDCGLISVSWPCAWGIMNYTCAAASLTPLRYSRWRHRPGRRSTRNRWNGRFCGTGVEAGARAKKLLKTVKIDTGKTWNPPGLEGESCTEMSPPPLSLRHPLPQEAGIRSLGFQRLIGGRGISQFHIVSDPHAIALLGRVWVAPGYLTSIVH